MDSDNGYCRNPYFIVTDKMDTVSGNENLHICFNNRHICNCSR